jgi:hypothetical protein
MWIKTLSFHGKKNMLVFSLSTSNAKENLKQHLNTCIIATNKTNPNKPMSNTDPENTNPNNITPENKPYDGWEGCWPGDGSGLDDLADLHANEGCNYGDNYCGFDDF